MEVVPAAAPKRAAPAAAATADDPTRMGWYWERLKAHVEEEFYNPAKFEANCKVLRAVAVFAAGIVISRNFGEALFVS